MNKVTPPIRQFSTRLVTHEVSVHASSAATPATPATALQVCEKMRPQVATLMGNGGFQALMTRALARASAEVPWLRNVHVNAAGTLEGKDQEIELLEPNKLIEGSSVLLGEMLGLLVNFIGPALTLRMVCEAWQAIQVSESDIAAGDTS